MPTDEGDLTKPYIAQILTQDSGTVVDYVTRDVSCVYERIDDRFEVIRDMHTREIIGCRLRLSPYRVRSLNAEQRGDG